jgi:hypothetical protein
VDSVDDGHGWKDTEGINLWNSQGDFLSSDK